MGMLRKLILILSVLLLDCCSNNDDKCISSKTFKSYSYDDIENKIISFDNCFEIDDNNYYLYFYQETCRHCLEIKNQIIYYAVNEYLDIYFVNINFTFNLANTLEDTIGVCDPYSAFTGTTPQLSLVINKEVYQTFLGSGQILNFLYTIET